MSVSKDTKRGTWKVYCYYTDWQGNRKPKMKRGFATKKEGQNWERDFLLLHSKDLSMTFEAFVRVYLDDKKERLKYNTLLTKQNIIEHKLIPYFGQKSMKDIKPSDVIQWQNTLLSFRDENGSGYSPTYMRTVQNQLSAIFNHAVKFYGLKNNPSSLAGKMGKAKSKEMLFWTIEEYNKFICTMKSKPISFYAFEVLYYCGLRIGELLALTQEDIDFSTNRLFVNKSYQRLHGEDYITEPKTEKSNRVIQLPTFLSNELQEYFGMLYGYMKNDRIFQFTKSYLHHEMLRGCRESGVKKIRIHDLRHSHVAYLIELGFSPVAIADRLGHEGIAITYNYAHLYPSKQLELANKLEEKHKEGK